ncbi:MULTISPECIES: TlpA disulfide reductase family protein [unclassified Clostridium]|uniref:TlpA family protein disulfide reductase n=1 Tax=unclassified Clostridium TaxID=2614128 RepID=UPI0002978D31|nr:MULTISPECIES: TlpA disulfide reductase family protein [unclassified Clostridium]EKQ51497.1 MAG: thiol-disulfide isomerase-like thioredoxin [Clostridium sp. Maddingley MBC34-26]
MKNKKLALATAAIGFAGFLTISYFGYGYLNSKYNGKNIKSKTEITQNKDFKNLIKQEKSMEKDFVVDDENLKKVKLSDYIGKPVVVNFWASWCPPCREEMPAFNEASSKYNQDKLVVLMVNLTDGQRETMDTAKKFLKDNSYNMKVLFDNDSMAAINYNILSIPRTLFIDKNGFIVEDHTGEISKDELDSQIETLLSN